MPKIAILIPCYNESMTVKNVITDYRKYLPEADIYVYDNNSSDQTAEIARDSGAIVRFEKRQGKGNVMRTMFREIEADCYLVVDGDDTYSAQDAQTMINFVLNENVDMVIGDRLSSTYFNENKRLFHNTGNRLVRYLINTLFKSDIKDIMTGYRALSRLFVKNYPVISKGFEIETEMTIHALDKNFTIKEIPVIYKDRIKGSLSKLNTFSDGYKVLKMIAKLFREYKPYAFFSSISIIGFLIATILFVPIIIEFLNTGIVPRFPTLIVSVTIYIISILMWICGIILEVIVSKHKQLYEILLNK
ncbi:glycosyltransferase family 2 protein [Sedimentibacter saalensis]|uniref:Cellulose synthase/poly-beta-1,6-N-acetylglucosamine synthase-like glycosyltransferase n=1 Tax=Sedimentibacter saalensis TaxID=130788 RepID=A0A562J2E0_9FIRM|nr:glycosyltransferase family 2 protein [Sedimentibacter saalensis]TWH77024.1 cellulose synthase/poly-beta-1,6-N-acetylglucosamine synthase-like glycosyltransferase [Sedimentibacter saalensis]